MVTEVDTASLLRDFYIDAARQVGNLRRHLDDSTGEDPAALRAALLAFRSIKAGASFLDQVTTASVCTWAEDLLRDLREGNLTWSPGLHSVLSDILGLVDGAVTARDLVATEAIKPLRDRVHALYDHSRGTPRPSDSVRVSTTQIIRAAHTAAVFAPAHGATERPRLHFGDFLVESGLLTAQQLLLALAEQERGQESHLAVLLAHSRVDPDLCLTMVNDAYASGRDVLLLADERDLIDDEERRAIADALRRSRPPLGQVLVKMGIADRRSVKSWLLAYYDRLSQERQLAGYVRSGDGPAAEAEAPAAPAVSQPPVDTRSGPGGPEVEPEVEASKPSPPPAEQPGPAAEEAATAAGTQAPGSEPAADEAAEIVMPEAQALAGEDNLIAEFLQVFNPEQQTALENAFVGMREFSGEELAEHLTVLYRDLHSLKGSCGFIGAAVSQRVIHVMEEAVGFVQVNAATVGVGEIDDLTDHLLGGLDLLWELRTAIGEFQDEGRLLEVMEDELRGFLHNLFLFMNRLAQRLADEAGDVEDLF